MLRLESTWALDSTAVAMDSIGELDELRFAIAGHGEQKRAASGGAIGNRVYAGSGGRKVEVVRDSWKLPDDFNKKFGYSDGEERRRNSMKDLGREVQCCKIVVSDGGGGGGGGGGCSGCGGGCGGVGGGCHKAGGGCGCGGGGGCRGAM
ncbi:hypothetical protein LguiA_025397 [Lonicera macranthoides]